MPAVTMESLRIAIYEQTIRAGTPPRVAELSRLLDRPTTEIRESLQRLADAHVIVLQQDSGEILMAAPWSAVPTAFLVKAGSYRAHGNCIWDALGILAALHVDGEIETSCADCGAVLPVRVRSEAVEGDGLIHFALPVREWWNDIVFT